MGLSFFSLCLSISVSLGSRVGEELSRVEKGMQPKAGLCCLSIKEAVNGLSVAVNFSLSADAGALASRGRGEPKHQQPAARKELSHSFGSKFFCFHSLLKEALLLHLLLLAPQGSGRSLETKTSALWEGEGPSEGAG